VELVRDGVLDAELAALLWLLLEARMPVVVVGRRGSGRSTLVVALLDLLPAGSRATRLAGAEEEFDWLPEAPELGWRRASPGARVGARSPKAVRAADTVLLAAGLGDGPPHGTPGPQARIAIRALSLGYGMAATMAGDGLEDVFATLHAPPVGADDDELSRLGIVLALKRVPTADAGQGEAVAVDGRPREAGSGDAPPLDPGAAPPRDPDPGLHRVVAAHYVRPVVRDAHGHVQRLPPAVLAAWEPRTDRLEHFAWGIVGELAGRTGLRAVEFEREQARRASYLAGLAAAGLIDPDDVRTAIAGYREAAGSRPD
jgi:energy-coupling factor transporter ATP-binding protein EcfA2